MLNPTIKRFLFRERTIPPGHFPFFPPPLPSSLSYLKEKMKIRFTRNRRTNFNMKYLQKKRFKINLKKRHIKYMNVCRRTMQKNCLKSVKIGYNFKYLYKNRNIVCKLKNWYKGWKLKLVFEILSFLKIQNSRKEF